MAEELMINVNVSGEVDVNKINKGVEKLGKTANKTQSEISKLRKEIKDAKDVMLTAEEGSVEYNNALKKISDSQFKLKDINDKSRAAVQDFGQTAKNIGGVVSGLAGGFSVLTGAMSLFGAENDTVTQAILKVQSAMAIASGFGQFADNIDSLKDLISGLRATSITSKASMTELGKSGEDVANGLSNIGKETAVITSNMSGGVTVTNSMNDAIKTLGENWKNNPIFDPKSVEGMTSELKGMEFQLNKMKSGAFGNVDSEAIKLQETSINNIQKEINNKSELINVTEKQSSSVLKQIGVMGLWVAAVTAVVIAISYLITKMNEIPKELEVKLKIDEEGLKNTEKARETISELKHDLDIINGKQDKNSKDQLKNIKAVMVEQGIATEKELKNLDTKASSYDKFFTAYLEKVKQTSKEEAIIKGKANAEINAEILKTQQETILEEVRKKISTGPNDKYADKFIEDWKKGNLSSFRIVQEGLTGLSNKWNETVDKQTEANKELSLYSKMYKDIQSNQNKSGKNPFLVEPVKTTGKDKTKKENIDFGLPIDQQVYDNVIDSLTKFNENLRKKQDEETKKNKEGWVKMTTPLLDDLKDPFDHLQWLYDNDYSTYDEFLNAKLELLQQYGLDTNKIQNEINSREIEGIRQTIASLGDLSSGISDLYQSQIDINDSKYEAEKENIENTVTNESAKNAKLKQLDAQYNKTQEKLFEQQKQAKLATAWMDFASGVVGIWSKDMSSLPTPYSQIIAGIETAALLATTVAQTRSIEAQKYNKASSVSSSSSSSSSSTSVALTPNQTALTSSEDRLNTNLNNQSNIPQQIVKVSDINKVQNTVSVRENNSQY